MADKEALVEKMRADWKVVAEDKRTRGEWSDADVKEIGDVVKTVVTGGDVEAILRWARWFSELASAVLLFSLVSNGLNGNIRAAVAEEKLKSQKGAK